MTRDLTKVLVEVISVKRRDTQVPPTGPSQAGGWSNVFCPIFVVKFTLSGDQRGKTRNATRADEATSLRLSMSRNPITQGDKGS